MKHWWMRYARIGVALFIAVLVLVALGTGTASAAGPVYHTVLPGQTLYSIAGYYGVSVWAISCANGLYNPNYIYAGMVLYIPYGYYGSCKPNYYPSQPIYHPPQQPVYPSQPIYYPKPAPCGCGTCGCGSSYYRVVWGDTLYSIAYRYHTTWQAIATANHLPNPNCIYAGMLLYIPTHY